MKFSCCLPLMILLLLAGCEATGEKPSETPARENGSPLSVYVVNYPLQYFAERIGGELADVHFPAPSEGDPAFWSPDAEIVSSYQNADLILLNGASYAKWVGLVTLPTFNLVDTSASFEDQYIYIEDTVTHSHGPEGAHSHGETAFTTWLDLRQAVEQARAVHEALVAARPQGAEAFQRGFDALESDLLALDQSLEEQMAGKGEQLLLASHPVYQYLARRYQLNLTSVHFEPDELPDATSWRELEQILAEHPAKWMLWEDAPIARSADKLRELGVESVVFNPCGNRPPEGDFLSVMKANVENLERVFE